ncbi:MAG: caspase family protein [Nitrospinae bacterium]|nr:caspase family protein [Nitrospinota bacterium]
MIGNTYNGAFTYYFCRHIRDSHGKINRAELLKRLRASLRHEGYSQIPQLEVSASAKEKEAVFQG